MNWRYWFILVLIPLLFSSCDSNTPDSTCPASANSTSAGCDPLSTNTTQTASAPSDSPARLSPSDRVPRITVQDVSQKLNSNADIFIIDARVDVQEQYPLGHIKGSIPVPLSKFTEEGWVASVALDKEIILYCT
jgi:hypothetical protein